MKRESDFERNVVLYNFFLAYVGLCITSERILSVVRVTKECVVSLLIYIY